MKHREEVPLGPRRVVTERIGRGLERRSVRAPGQGEEAAHDGRREDGVARAGMGVDAADYDRSGRPSIIISNFSNQMMSLYHNEGNGLFVDEAPRSSIGQASLLTLGFGCFFFDYDLDGWPDVFVANGHLDSDIERIQKRITFRQPPHLFHNLGNGKFEAVGNGGFIGQNLDAHQA